MSFIKFFYSFLLLTYLVIPQSILAQSGEIIGSVAIPQIKKSERTFRGSVYRNRLSTDESSEKSTTTAKSIYEDVIVSAHPLSFTPDVSPPSEPVKMSQIGATFVPHVLAVLQGSTVNFVNEDEFYHNVYSETSGAKFNLGRKSKGVSSIRRMPAASAVSRQINGLGEIKLFCDIHAQMNAIILSLDTPFFTRVKPDGNYDLKNLPDGDYEVRAYHPELPLTTEKISISKGQVVRKNFVLTN